VACAARWQVPIAVNLSASQLVPQLPQKISTYLQRHGLPPQALILEVTEQVVLNEASLSVLQQLALQGHPLHLDDFGTGFSSLERITALPLAAIKLGLGFIQNLGLNPNPESPGARLLRAVLALGKGLSLEVIVEGIETEAQLEFLLKEGFSYGQGYLLGRPEAIGHDEQLQRLGQGSERR
jgi:EAL domain-containing protein (putative c-di-GMP-specific phosphodiesterase class I)